MRTKNSHLDHLLDTYERQVKNTPHLGHQRWHIEAMFGKLRAFLADLDSLTEAEQTARINKANRWLGFIQGWLWAREERTIEEMADETRGIDSAWQLHRNRVEGAGA